MASCYRSQGSLAKLEGDSADNDTQLTKLDVVLTFQLEVFLTPPMSLPRVTRPICLSSNTNRLSVEGKKLSK